MTFTDADKQIINQFIKDVGASELNALSTEDELWELISPKAKILIGKILSLDPREYGFKGQELPVEPVPSQTVKVEAEVDSASGEYKLSKKTYLPPVVFVAFNRMTDAFNKEHPGRQLLVGSGYRSPASQIITLVYILARVYDFDISQTLKRVAMPHYSQHCSVSHTAIDMLNIDGQPTDNDPQEFSKSVEYAWLLKNANNFDFYESYPPNNPDGIMWEPWHWQYRG